MQLNVLYGCDDNYAPYTGISLLSLFENNKDIEEITIYLAAMNFSEVNLSKFRRLAEQYGRKLVILDTERAQEYMKTYQCKGWNGSLATWLRFFVLEQIPEDVNRLLWIDSDTIVNGSLRDLIEIPLEGYPVAAVCDSVCYWERFRLGIAKSEPYFNAGVILFNLPVWQGNDVLGKMMEHLEKYVQYYKANDQDLLNDFFKGQILKLPMRYNLQGFQLGYPIRTYFSVYHWDESAYYTQDEAQSAVAQPCIIHFFRFLGDYPWQQGKNYHPVRERYLRWQARSPWKEHPGAPKRTDAVFKVEKFLYRLLPKKCFLHLFAWFTNRKVPKVPVDIRARENIK